MRPSLVSHPLTDGASRSLLPLLLLAAVLAPPPIGAQSEGSVEAARFHHVHLNVVDRERSIDFYRRIFGAVPLDYRGRQPALFTERSFLLLNQVEEAADGSQESGIWHIGWGGVDMPNEYRWLVSQGVEIHTPLYSLGRGHVVYVNGPDREMIEVNTMGHHRFAHVHLLARDPNRTAAWYGEHLGLEPRRSAEENPKPVGPGARYESWQAFHAENRAWSNGFRCDNVSFVVYNLPDYDPPPPWWRFPPLSDLEPQRGRAIDHFAFSYRDLEPVLARLQAAGVEILSPIRRHPELGFSSFFVMGPDRVAIEIVEEKPIPEGIWD